MSEPTRKQALIKLERIYEKIGYPEKWKDYAGLRITRESYYENARRASAWEFDRDIAKIGKPLDRAEWRMTPSIVNAYYEAPLNEIVFPAGILQPPFFDPRADEAVNYGAIGVVIGHEITHGFDDKGSQYDAEGNLKNWWGPEDLKAFKERGECIASQFSQYFVDGDAPIQGKLVEGEAIADLGGVTLALRAYEKSIEGKPAPAAIGGLTPQQRFFVGFATVWASAIRPQYARLLATVDSHPPARWRVNGTLANVEAFSKAYACEPGPLSNVAAKRCQIW
jgi:putative endopeptidase